MKKLKRSVKTCLIFIAFSLGMFSYSTLSDETAYSVAEAQTSEKMAEKLEMFKIRQELNAQLVQMVKENKPNEVLRLLELGADPNATNKVFKGSKEKRYYNREPHSNYSEPILHTASLARNTQIVQLLVEHGSDIKAKDYCDMTALHLAGNGEIGEMLLDNGADPIIYPERRSFKEKSVIIIQAIQVIGASVFTFGDNIDSKEEQREHICLFHRLLLTGGEEA